MNRFIILLIYGAALLPFGAAVKDAHGSPQHLEPVEGVFYQFGDDYYQRIREILIGDKRVKSLARMLTIPSFVPERVVTLIKNEKDYVVILKAVSKPIWPDRSKGDTRVIENAQVLDETTAWLISDVFLKATNNTRYPKEEHVGLDGAAYYFSAAQYKTGSGYPREGKTWSPETESTCGQLVALGQLMEKYALANKSDAESVRLEITKNAKRLLTELSASP
jgi:hypothetical protein